MAVSGRRKQKDGDDRTTGILCDPCLGVNEEENAVFYCTVCNEFLCETDAKAHRKAAISKAHRLLDRNSMPRQTIGSYEDNLCPVHAGEILKYYCNSHCKLCCSVCTTKEHKHCQVEYIDDIAEGYEKSSEYKLLMKDMKDLTRRLHSVKQLSVENTSNAQRLHSEIVSQISKLRKEINRSLDSLENASLKEAKIALHVDSDAAESTTKRCDALMAKLQEMTSSIENLRKYKQERQLVMHSKNATAHLKDIEDEVSKLSALNEIKQFTFIPDMTISQFIRSLDSLGRLEPTEESVKPKEYDQKARKGHDAEVLVPVVNQPVTASHVRDINIRHSTDKTPVGWITGGVMVEHDKLVLADYNNNSVKVVDINSNNVTSCIKLPSAPSDITRLEQNNAVVSCDGGKLVFLKVGKTLSIIRQLYVGGELRGIAYTNNSLFVGFGFPDHCVKIMDLSWNVLRTFKTDAAGNNIFKDPWYIALSEDQNTIFVSDQGNECVTSLRIDGAVRDVYTSGNLRYPRGLAVDRNHNVYVGVSGSHTIHQLSTECQPVKVLLDTAQGIKLPWMVTYCKTENKLYIGYHSASGKNYISVFQLH